MKKQKKKKKWIHVNHTKMTVCKINKATSIFLANCPLSIVFDQALQLFDILVLIGEEGNAYHIYSNKCPGCLYQIFQCGCVYKVSAFIKKRVLLE